MGRLEERVTEPRDRTILVLEDNEQRVRWLRRIVREHADVLHTETVPDFLATLEIEPDLILMDHDLGTTFDGRDAARHMETRSPIVVWSCNSTRGPQMVDILEERGLDVFPVWVPFGSTEIPLIVRMTLRDGRLPGVQP
jgi:CheY-like chemotaxis protein